MCLFFHRWKYELLERLHIKYTESTIEEIRWIYLGTCQKCGRIHKKVIASWLPQGNAEASRPALDGEELPRRRM